MYSIKKTSYFQSDKIFGKRSVCFTVIAALPSSREDVLGLPVLFRNIFMHFNGCVECELCNDCVFNCFQKAAFLEKSAVASSLADYFLRQSLLALDVW